MKLLEKTLTKIPMYTLVAGGLSVLVASALVLSLADTLAFDAGALALSLAVFTVASAGASYGLGKAYGVPSHLRSSLITALILTLLFTPSLDPGVLTQYTFIAVIAQASKYVLTVRRRHIFNPAAVGALIGGAVLQLQFASWWIATPVLFVPLFIAAFLVLYKTRELALGGIFISTAVAVVALGGLLRGEGLLEALAAALLSWPIIFVAGFMLSEPLTLPPRHWQKLVIGAVVAAIVALPFHIGGFYSSPEFALVIGNLLALVLAFRHRRAVSLTFKEQRQLTPTSKEFIFELDHPAVFEPGQYIELTLPHRGQDIRGTRRSFSITSTPGERELRLGIKFYNPSSTFKQQLLQLEEGTVVQSTGITGDFVLPRDPKEKLLLIAGGIGITPFISHILANQTRQRDIILLYFTVSPDEAAYQEIINNSSAVVHNFVATNVRDGFVVSPILTDDILEKYVPDLDERHAYISGPPVMITSVKHLLQGRAKHIKTDYFSGY